MYQSFLRFDMILSAFLIVFTGFITRFESYGISYASLYNCFFYTCFENQQCLRLNQQCHRLKFSNAIGLNLSIPSAETQQYHRLKLSNGIGWNSARHQLKLSNYTGWNAAMPCTGWNSSTVWHRLKLSNDISLNSAMTSAETQQWHRLKLSNTIGWNSAMPSSELFIFPPSPRQQYLDHPSYLQVWRN